MTLNQLKEKIIDCRGIINLNADDVNQFSAKAAFKIATFDERSIERHIREFAKSISGKNILICLFIPSNSHLAMSDLAPLSTFAETLSADCPLVWGIEYQPKGESQIQITAIYE